MRHTLTPHEFQLVFDVLFHLSQSDFSKRLPEMQSATRLGSIILLLNMIAERLTVLAKSERAAAFGQLITVDYFLSDGKLFLSDPETERQLYILEDRRKDLHNGYSFDTVIAEESLSAFAELVSRLQKGHEAVTLPLSVLLADRRLVFCCCEFGPVTDANFGEMHIIILPELLRIRLSKYFTINSCWNSGRSRATRRSCCKIPVITFVHISISHYLNCGCSLICK